jgi:hypothetical protein
MIRIVRQGRVRTTRERWLLHGLVRIVTHPRPHWKACPPWFVEATAPLRAVPTGADPDDTEPTQPESADAARQPQARGRSSWRAFFRRRLTEKAGQT